MLNGNIRVERLSAEHKADFYRVHGCENNTGWCFCAAWRVPSWDGWGERTGVENRIVRERLFEQGIYDGYLLYVKDEPVGWCQAGLRDVYPKLLKTYSLSPDPSIWAVTCFLLVPRLRGKGLANLMLTKILNDLRRRGAKKVQVFPHCGKDLSNEDVWTGPEFIFVTAGFTVVKAD
jgi:GNAT superfamily N-acetyltransferase